MKFLKYFPKNLSKKSSFIQKELNKSTTNIIGNHFQSQYHLKKENYDYNRLYFNLLDEKMKFEEKNKKEEK
jgi:hypothetical protein